jgi:hypothetical protein
MDIENLAALIAIRNHIVSVLNDRNLVTKDGVVALDRLRISIDKKFVEEVQKLDVNKLFEVSKPSVHPMPIEVAKVNRVENPEEHYDLLIEKTEQPQQLALPLEPKNALKKLEPVKEEPVVTETDEALAKRIAEEKAKLKASGRSNKKKSNKDDNK